MNCNSSQNLASLLFSKPNQLGIVLRYFIQNNKTYVAPSLGFNQVSCHLSLNVPLGGNRSLIPSQVAYQSTTCSNLFPRSSENSFIYLFIFPVMFGTPNR